MKIKDYMNKYGVSYQHVIKRIYKKELPATKAGRDWEITLDVPPPARKENGEGKLKDKYTEIQIRKIEQQLETGKKAIREEFKGEVIEAVVLILNNLSSILAKLGLKKKDLQKVKAEIKRSLKELKEAGEVG